MNASSPSSLIRSRHARVTTVLVGANILIFLATALVSRSWLQISPMTLVALGGNVAPAIEQGEYWRFFSSIFLHGGLMHIGFNMLALWQVGQLVERLYGAFCFSLIYLGSGILGGALSFWWHPGPVSIGASGAIFGVYGALLMFLLMHRGKINPAAFHQLRSSTLLFIGYTLFAGYAIAGIDNAAHIGGLVGGFLLGGILEIVWPRKI